MKHVTRIPALGAAILVFSTSLAAAQCVGFSHPRVCGPPGARYVEGSGAHSGLSPREALRRERAAVGITPQVARMIRPGVTVTCSGERRGSTTTATCEVSR